MNLRCPDCGEVAPSRSDLLKHEILWTHGRYAEGFEVRVNDSEWLHVQGSIAVSAYRLNSRSTFNARSDEQQPEEGS